MKKVKKNKKGFSNHRPKKLSNGQIWWRSMTAEEQANWRYENELAKGKKNVNWDAIYTKVIEEGLYAR